MAYHFFDHPGGVGVTLKSESLPALFADACAAFTDSITVIDRIEPRRPEEVDVDAPELDVLLMDFLSELLYRFDTRAWLTRHADVALREKDGAWTLEGTLRGEKLDTARHDVRVMIRAVTYHGLKVQQQGRLWTAKVVFKI
jgi:SHS2 domain-containing protein